MLQCMALMEVQLCNDGIRLLWLETVLSIFMECGDWGNFFILRFCVSDIIYMEGFLFLSLFLSNFVPLGIVKSFILFGSVKLCFWEPYFTFFFFFLKAHCT